jgi:hypothetical protein
MVLREKRLNDLKVFKSLNKQRNSIDFSKTWIQPSLKKGSFICYLINNKNSNALFTVS